MTPFDSDNERFRPRSRRPLLVTLTFLVSGVAILAASTRPDAAAEQEGRAQALVARDVDVAQFDPSAGAEPRVGEVRTVSADEAALLVSFPVRELAPPEGWELAESTLQHFDLPVPNPDARPIRIEWFHQVFTPTDSTRGDHPIQPQLVVIQNNVAKSPQTLPTSAETIEQVGTIMYATHPPAGVHQGGAVSFWADGGQYIVNSNVLPTGELIDLATRLATQ